MSLSCGFGRVIGNDRIGDYAMQYQGREGYLENGGKTIVLDLIGGTIYHSLRVGLRTGIALPLRVMNAALSTFAACLTGGHCVSFDTVKRKWQLAGLSALRVLIGIGQILLNIVASIVKAIGFQKAGNWGLHLANLADTKFDRLENQIGQEEEELAGIQYYDSVLRWSTAPAAVAYAPVDDGRSRATTVVDGDVANLSDLDDE